MDPAWIQKIQTGLFQEFEKQKSEHFLEYLFFQLTDSLQTNLGW